MIAASLFEGAVARPLAERLRPGRLDDVVGQDHLLGADGPLRRMIAARRLASLILWGPPGVGKTTIARLLAQAVGIRFESLSAVMAGVSDLRKVLDAARLYRQSGGATLLFVDEIHRWNKAQQDALLPYVEDGTVILVGATTENPSMALVSALLSRTTVLTLNRFTEPALEHLLCRAEQEQGQPLPLTPAARAALRQMADGDGRYLLNLAEQIYDLEPAGLLPAEALDVPALGTLLRTRLPHYDKDQDAHYGLLSCFHKTLRGSDADAALYYAARMVLAGEAPATLFRRLACCASEDVGMADPQALPQVIAAWTAFERVGWPEGRLFLAQAILYVATAPKSNAGYMAFEAAMTLARQSGSPPPPRHLVNASTRMMAEMGFGRGYAYDHDCPDAFSGQEFFPDALSGPARPRFYHPNPRGFERDVQKRLEYWERLRHKRQTSRNPAGGDPP